MDVAQQKLVRLVQAQRGSRIGLVLFAGTSIMRSPLTTDTQAMEQLILRADTEAGLDARRLRPRRRPAAGCEHPRSPARTPAGRSSSSATAKTSPGRTRRRLAACARTGIAVFTAGVGTTAGGPLFNVSPLTGATSPKLDAQGRQVVTRLDEGSLQSIAESGGGSYMRLDGDATSLLGIRNDLNRLDQTPLGADISRLPIERFQVFAAAALVLLLLSWFLPSRIRVPSIRATATGAAEPGPRDGRAGAVWWRLRGGGPAEGPQPGRQRDVLAG